MYHDNFSALAERYQLWRPQWPRSVFDWLAQVSLSTEMSWDCGCGNGQATVLLAELFKNVVGTDASSSQLQLAPKNKGIVWRQAIAHESGLGHNSVDLCLIAQALHWFATKEFYAECQRVIKPGGLICALSYGHMKTSSIELNAVLQKFNDIIEPYWDKERWYVDTHYQNLLFPFQRIEAPLFDMKEEWNIEQIIGYLSSWSGLRHYQKVNRGDGLLSRTKDRIDQVLLRDEIVTVTWPLVTLTGRVE